VLWVGARLAWRKGSVFWVRVTAAALTAAFVGHFVDQLVNVPRAADSAAFWTLVGAMTALCVVAARANASQESARAASPPASRLRPVLAALAPAIAVPLAAGILALTWLGNAGHVRADFEAARLQSAMTQGARVSDISTIAGEASGLAPDVAHYHTLEAMALESAAGVLLPGSAAWAQFEARALDARRAAVAASPLGPAERLSLARAFYRRAVAVEPDMIGGAVAEYETAVALAPRFWGPWLELAAAYGEAGRTADGVAALQKASDLLRKQAQVTREDPATLSEFAAAHRLLGLEPGAYYP
jgi:tetratricopeptide (TPR) repeat protein